MPVSTSHPLVDRQVAGLNDSNLDEVVAVYADDAKLVVASPHSLPGSERRYEGIEGITKHMGFALKGGVRDVKVTWVGQGDGILAWRDEGIFGEDTTFSESHTATVADGKITEHHIHSIYAKG